MSPESWRAVNELYNAVCDLPAGARQDLLGRADPQVRAEVEAILEAQSSALDHPAWEGRRTLLEKAIGVAVTNGATETVLTPGALIGRYRIEASLGEGGMGQVFRAHDTRLGRTVALKLVRTSYAERQDFRSRLEREARTASSLNHPNICALYDVGEQDGTPFLVMEYIEGETLTAVLKKSPLAVEDTLRYGGQIASALAAAHARHIIHRDLKPSNIIITPAGAKVLDFGIAKNLASDAEQAPPLSETEPGRIVGTPAYMSPEQIAGKAVDCRSDIFSLGVVLYEMSVRRRHGRQYDGRRAPRRSGASPLAETRHTRAARANRDALPRKAGGGAIRFRRRGVSGSPGPTESQAPHQAEASHRRHRRRHPVAGGGRRPRRSRTHSRRTDSLGREGGGASHCATDRQKPEVGGAAPLPAGDKLLCLTEIPSVAGEGRHMTPANQMLAATLRLTRREQ
jgi:hypothetical protein